MLNKIFYTVVDIARPGTDSHSCESSLMFDLTVTEQLAYLVPGILDAPSRLPSPFSLVSCAMWTQSTARMSGSRLSQLALMLLLARSCFIVAVNAFAKKRTNRLLLISGLAAK